MLGTYAVSGAAVPNVAFVQNHVGGASKVTGTTLVLALSADVALGNTLVMKVAFDNVASGGGPIVSSITVPGGESATWVQLGAYTATGTGAASVVGEVWAIKTTQQWLFASFSPTVTIDVSRNGKAGVIQEFSGVTTVQRGTVAIGTSLVGAPTATNTAPVLGDLVVGGSGWETGLAITGDSDTTNGSWSAVHSIATVGGVDTTNLVAALQYKIVTATGSQTYNPTGTSNDSGVVLSALQPA